MSKKKKQEQVEEPTQPSLEAILENLMHDDHGPVIIGSRDKKPQFLDVHVPK